MNVGLALPQFDGISVPGEDPLTWTTVIDCAQRAERLGFDSIWFADHLFYDVGKYGAAPGGHDGFDPLVALGALARATTRVRLGTLVLCTQLRPPAIAAKALATLDVLSGGRVIAGMGAGWHRPEFEVAGVSFEPMPVRLEQLGEAIQIVAGLFAHSPFTFDGARYQITDAWCLPAPVQRPRPPIWVGGKGDGVLRVTAEHADGWNAAWDCTLDAYRERLAVLDRCCEQAGRDPASVTRTVGLYALVGEDARDLAARFEQLKTRSPAGVLDGMALEDWRRGRLVGTVDEVRSQMQAWEELGVSTLIVSAGALPFSVSDVRALDTIAAAVT